MEFRKSSALAASVLIAAVAIAGCSSGRDRSASSVNESAPARTGAATVPTARADTTAPATTARSPSSVNESQPARAATPTTPSYSSTSSATATTGAANTGGEQPMRMARQSRG